MTHKGKAAVVDTSLGYRRLIACFFVARYRRLIACFFGLLQDTLAYFSGPSSLTYSAKSAILKLKGGENKIFTFCMMFRKVISLPCEKIYFSDRYLNYENVFCRYNLKQKNMLSPFYTFHLI